MQSQSMGERIKEIRKRNQLKQAEFASRVCLSRPFISRIENDKEIPSRTAIRLISILFDIKEE